MCLRLCLFLLVITPQIAIASGQNKRRKSARQLFELTRPLAPPQRPLYGPPSGTSPLKPGQQRCGEDARDCGLSNRQLRPQAKIINGTETKPHEYPWLAILTTRGDYTCGASLITDFHVLTAAHCLKSDALRDDLKVILGQFDNCKATSDTVTFSVSDIIRHSRYNPETFAFDVMLLKLNMRVTFGDIIRPICLPPFDIYQRTVATKYLGEDALIVGWGTTTVYDDTALSCLPRQVSLPVLPLKDCPGYDESLFCAGYLDGTADSCQGDSGGPLQLANKDSRFELIGIISSGEGCAVAGKAGLYTDILQNLHWIFKRIAGSTCSSYQNGYRFY